MTINLSKKDFIRINYMPGVLGLVVCDQQGEVLSQHGDGIEAIGQSLVYFRQLLELIGGTCGVGDLNEGQFAVANGTLLLVPLGSDTLGVLCEPKAKLGDLLQQISQLENTPAHV